MTTEQITVGSRWVQQYASVLAYEVRQLITVDGIEFAAVAPLRVVREGPLHSGLGVSTTPSIQFHRTDRFDSTYARLTPEGEAALLHNLHHRSDTSMWREIPGSRPAEEVSA